MSDSEIICPRLSLIQFDGFRKGWQIYLRDFKFLIIKKRKKMF